MSRTEISPADLQLFHGDGTVAGVRVYARLLRDDLPADVTLTGTLTGPFSRYAHTLPATYRFAWQGSDPWPLANTLIPEACTWTPDAPYGYYARLEIRRGDELLALVERPWGWRPVAFRNGQMLLEGRPWVARAWALSSFPTADERDQTEHTLTSWREAATAYCGPASDDLCSAATETGVWLLARIAAGVDVTAEIKRLAQWPAVAMIVVPDGGCALGPLRHLAPSTLLACQRDLDGPPTALSDDIDAVIVHIPPAMPVEEQGRRLAAWTQRCSVPLLAYRPQEELATVEAARAACDRLQRDLAGSGRFVGYMV